MGTFRRSRALFVGGLLIAILLAACGKSATREPEDAAAGGSIGIPALDSVRSGELEATLNVNMPKQGTVFTSRIIGSFLGAAGWRMPQIDGAAEADGELNGEALDLSTALIATHDRAVLTYDGQTFETDPRTFESLESSFEGAMGDGSGADTAACLEAAGRLDPSQIIDKLTRPVDTTLFDGTAVTMTSAKLEPSGLAAALRSFTEDPGCGAQLRAAGELRDLFREVATELEHGVKEAEGRLSVDNKGILRELSIHLTLGAHGSSDGEAEFLIRLMEVNEVDKLPPCHGERPLAALVKRLGFNPLEPIEREGERGLVGLLDGIFGRTPVESYAA